VGGPNSGEGTDKLHVVSRCIYVLYYVQFCAYTQRLYFFTPVLHRLKAVFLYHSVDTVTLRANKHGAIVVQGVISQGPKSSPKFSEVIFMKENITIITRFSL
jgi:hypothetical protein